MPFTKQDFQNNQPLSVLDHYRRQRGLTKTELARLTGLGRGKIQELITTYAGRLGGQKAAHM